MKKKDRTYITFNVKTLMLNARLLTMELDRSPNSRQSSYTV